MYMALDVERSGLLVLVLQPTGVQLITGLSSSYDARMPRELVGVCGETAWTDAMLKINKYAPALPTSQLARHTLVFRSLDAWPQH
jgi:hypothetical protein